MSDQGFGALLRGWRDRTASAAGASRRTPGMRREELAALAGISMDYLVQLEQGRAARPSAAVVASLARALRLSAADSALLHAAAGLAAPTAPVDRSVPTSVSRLLSRFAAWPAAVYSADWWLLQWNPAWAALHGDPLLESGRRRNLVWHELTAPPTAFADPAEREEFRDSLVGDLRVALVAHPDDAELVDLIDALHASSPEFTERWHAARPTLYRGAHKHVAHAVVGDMDLDSDILQTPGSDVRLIVYSAEPGSVSAERLERLTGVLVG